MLTCLQGIHLYIASTTNSAHAGGVAAGLAIAQLVIEAAAIRAALTAMTTDPTPKEA